MAGQEYRTARGARENVEKNLKDSSIRHPNLSPSLRYPIVVNRSTGIRGVQSLILGFKIPRILDFLKHGLMVFLKESPHRFL